jgi:hypothetical protein
MEIRTPATKAPTARMMTKVRDTGRRDDDGG